MCRYIQRLFKVWINCNHFEAFSALLEEDILLEGEQQVIGVFSAVDVVVDGDEPAPVLREPSLQIVAGVDVVPAEAGQVLDQDTVNASGLNILDHPLEAGAVKIGAGVAVST